MNATNNIFETKKSQKIVQKIEETIELPIKKLIQTGKLILIRNKSDRAPKSCNMALTASTLYYIRNSLETNSDDITMSIRAKIELSWLRLRVYTKADPRDKRPLNIIELKRENKTVAFICPDDDQFAIWVRHLSYLTIQTGFDMRYKVGNEIGEGDSAKVYKIFDTHTQQFFACKKFLKSKLVDKDELGMLMKEITILRLMKGHPHIVELFEVYETESEVCLVLELMQGERVIERKRKYRLAEVKIIGQSILSALVRLKDDFIVHRDLKPGNVLLKDYDRPLAENVIKIIDFGISNFYNGDEKFNNYGTPGYLAPENITKDAFQKLDPISDMFSLGVMLYNALTGSQLFIQNDDRATVSANKKARVDFEHPDIKMLPSMGKLNS